MGITISWWDWEIRNRVEVIFCDPDPLRAFSKAAAAFRAATDGEKGASE